MREVCFENYDARFNDIYTNGDIIVSGRNFGTGSSREQAPLVADQAGGVVNLGPRIGAVGAGEVTRHHRRRRATLIGL